MNVREVLKLNNFRFNKNLGQNFLTDLNLLQAIVADSGIGPDDIVVEVGTGAGTLTAAIAAKAKKVISFEVDKNLAPVLETTLAGIDNVTVVFKDILKMSDCDIEKICGGRFKVVANIPYYITTTLIMKFVESSLDIGSVTVMIQKEVANRLTADHNTGDYGAITMSVNLRGKASVTRTVSRNMFYPVPNVDSAVVHIEILPDKFPGVDKEFTAKVIRSCFNMRRKTLQNNLISSFGITKERAADVLRICGFSPMIRGEALSVEDVIRLAEELKKLI